MPEFAVFLHADAPEAAPLGRMEEHGPFLTLPFLQW